MRSVCFQKRKRVTIRRGLTSGWGNELLGRIVWWKWVWTSGTRGCGVYCTNCVDQAALCTKVLPRIFDLWPNYITCDHSNFKEICIFFHKRAIYWGKYEANESPKVANMYYEIRTWWPIGVCWLSLSITYWTNNGRLFFFFSLHCKCNAMKVVWFVDNKILWVPWTTVLLMSRQPKRK